MTLAATKSKMLVVLTMLFIGQGHMVIDLDVIQTGCNSSVCMPKYEVSFYYGSKIVLCNRDSKTPTISEAKKCTKIIRYSDICLRKTFGRFFSSYSELLSKFGEISFLEYVFEGISHPVVYDDLVYKLRRVKCEANFVSTGSKIVKRLRRRKYDPVLVKRTIGLVLGPSTALYRSFLKHCIPTNKAVGMTGLVKISSEETRARSSSPLIVSRDFFSPWTWAPFQTGGA